MRHPFVRQFSADREHLLERCLHSPLQLTHQLSGTAPGHSSNGTDWLKSTRWASLDVQTSEGSFPSPNIPGTPSALARRGPTKPLHSEVKKASARSAHTHTDIRYLGWALRSHQDYKNKHNTIKMDGFFPSLSPHPIYSHPLSTFQFSWTHGRCLDNKVKILDWKRPILLNKPTTVHAFLTSTPIYSGDSKVLG